VGAAVPVLSAQVADAAIAPSVAARKLLALFEQSVKQPVG
jgi:hypothetical protein